MQCTIQAAAACRQAAAPARPQQPCSSRARVPAVGRQHSRLAARAQPKPLESVDDINVNEYCSLDAQGRRVKMTLGEKEQAFLEALSAFYYDGQPAMTNEEFDMLKDELVWSGSKVAVLSSDEQRFLEAQQAYNKGKKTVISDSEFDQLKLKLKQSGSIITAQGPRCSIRSRRMYSDASVDYLKLTAINFPAALLVLGGVFSIDDLTGFEITKLVELPEPYGIVALWGVLLPTVYVLATSITNLVFKDALILKAPCPNCGTQATTYFGDILTVSGNREKNTIQCGNCKSQLAFDAVNREVEVEEPAAAA